MINFNKIVKVILFLSGVVLLIYSCFLYLDFSVTLQFEHNSKAIVPDKIDPDREKDILVILSYLRFIIIFIIIAISSVFLKSKK